MRSRLLLLGGGHSHAIALTEWARSGCPDAAITLVSPGAISGYSGMLPGVLAGVYPPAAIGIDLVRLCRRIGVTFRPGRVVGLDLRRQEVVLAAGDRLPYDWLSLNLGSTPPAIPGRADGVLAVKPIDRCLQGWMDWLVSLGDHPTAPLQVGIVGGGVAGVELALGVDARLRRLWPSASVQVTLLQRGLNLLRDQSPEFRRRCRRTLERRGIDIRVDTTVAAIEAGPTVVTLAGDRLPFDQLLWATGAVAPAWLAQSGLATDAQGFVRVEASLRSHSHPQVFAVGDVAALDPPVPKSGVYAVRQGPLLAESLRRAIAGEPLRSSPSSRPALVLLGTGNGEAIAARGAWSAGPHPFWWWLKQGIDRRFMARLAGA